MLGLATGVPTHDAELSGGTGRRGHWSSSAAGVNLLSLIATLAGRGAAAHPQLPVVSGHGASVAPQRGGHRKRHPSLGAACPTGSGRDPGPHPHQPGGSLPTKPAWSGPAAGPTATCGLSAPAHRTLILPRCRGKTVVDGRCPILAPEYWSAISTLPTTMLPTTIMMAPSSGAGRTPVQARGRLCCGTSTTSEPATPKMPHRPDGPRQSTSSMSQPKPATITSHGKGVLPNWPGSGSCWPSAALSCLTRRLSRASCAGASSATSKACPVLDTGNSSSSWPNRTCQRTTTRPSAACAIWSSAARSAAAPARSRAPSAR